MILLARIVQITIVASESYQAGLRFAGLIGLPFRDSRSKAPRQRMLFDCYDLAVCCEKLAECFRVQWFDARTAIDLWSCLFGGEKLGSLECNRKGVTAGKDGS